METNTRSLQDNGFERVVFKPFDTEDLMATVRGVLDRAGAEESAG
jgi:DNA-binding response OmpR family regulator